MNYVGKWRKTVTDHRHTAADQNDRGHKKPPCQEIKAAAARAAFNMHSLTELCMGFFQLQLNFTNVSSLLLLLDLVQSNNGRWRSQPGVQDDERADATTDVLHKWQDGWIGKVTSLSEGSETKTSHHLYLKVSWEDVQSWCYRGQLVSSTLTVPY